MTEIPDRATVQAAIDELIAARPKLAIAHHNRLRIIVTAARLWLGRPPVTDHMKFDLVGGTDPRASLTREELGQEIRTLLEGNTDQTP
jgi:hypothetical protein